MAVLPDYINILEFYPPIWPNFGLAVSLWKEDSELETTYSCAKKTLGHFHGKLTFE